MDNTPTASIEVIKPYIQGKDIYILGGNDAQFKIKLDQEGANSVDIKPIDFYTLDISGANLLFTAQDTEKLSFLVRKVINDDWKGIIITRLYPLTLNGLDVVPPKETLHYEKTTFHIYIR